MMAPCHRVGYLVDQWQVAADVGADVAGAGYPARPIM
jgi:hypothetical protein